MRITLTTILLLIFSSLVFADITVTIPDDARIQIPIHQHTIVGDYNDALYFTPTQYVATTPAQINQMIQDRVNNWVSMVRTPPPPPTQEQIQADIDAIQAQINQLTAQKANEQTILTAILAAEATSE